MVSILPPQHTESKDSMFSELKKHKFIVMGYEHYNPLGVIRSLGENGIRPILIILRSNIKVASKSKYISETFFCDNNQEAYDILIKRFGNECYKPFVIPCDENITEVLDLNYDVVNEKFYVSNAGGCGRITRFQNKNVLNELAEKSGLNIPKSWFISNGNIADDIEYPVITKPLTSYENWKSDYYICNNEKELVDAIKKIRKSDILVQRFIKKRCEFNLAGISFNGGNDVFVSACSESAYVIPDYFSMKNIHNKLDDKTLYEKVKLLFKAVGYEGIFSVDFLVDQEGTKFFLEVNFRNSAFSYVSTKLGMNLPLLWAYASYYHQLPEDSHIDFKSNYISMAEISDFEYRVHRWKLISVFQWMREMKQADCLLVWNRGDLKPAISMWVCKAKNFMRKLVN